MRFGSLFTGIGGFDLGFERAGMECAWQVEIDEDCQGVLARHWPGVRRFGDVREVRFGKRKRAGRPEPVDIICGGFPCQDVSVAGRRKGLAGERSGLWFEFHRIVEECHPRWVVIENVPGLLSSNGGRDFARIIQGMVKLGYGVVWRILDAQYFGVAQRRRRVFVVASLGDGCAAPVLFEREGVRGDFAEGGETGEGVAFTLAASVRGSGDGHGQGWNSNYVTAPLKAQDPGRRNGGSAPIADEFVLARPLAHGQTVNHMDESQQTFIVEQDVSKTLGSHHGRNDLDSMGAYVVGPIQAHSREHGHAMTTQQAVEAGQIIAFDETQITSPVNRSNPQPGDPSHPLAEGATPPTVAFAWQQGTSTQGGREYIVRKGDYAGSLSESRQDAVMDGFRVRRLTPVECERLQGFPDGWTDGQADSVRYRQLGNAVAVPVAEWIGRRLAEQITSGAKHGG